MLHGKAVLLAGLSDPGPGLCATVLQVEMQNEMIGKTRVILKQVVLSRSFQLQKSQFLYLPMGSGDPTLQTP